AGPRPRRDPRPVRHAPQPPPARPRPRRGALRRRPRPPHRPGTRRTAASGQLVQRGPDGPPPPLGQDALGRILGAVRLPSHPALPRGPVPRRPPVEAGHRPLPPLPAAAARTDPRAP